MYADKAKLVTRIKTAIVSGDDKAITNAIQSVAQLGRSSGPLALEHRQKISAARKGKPLTQEHRQKIGRGELGRVQSIATRSKISATRAARIVSGEIAREKRGISGDMYSEKNGTVFHYRSQLERCWYEQFECDTTIKAYKPEPFVIPYMYNGVMRRYVPDVLVHYFDGRVTLIEIKPEFRWTDEKNIAKWRYAKAFCKIQVGEMQFKVLGYLELEALEEQLARPNIAELRPVVAGPAVDVAADQKAIDAPVQLPSGGSDAPSLVLPDSRQTK